MSTKTKQPIEQAESGNLVKPVLANRLLKFRVFHKSRKKMYEVFSFCSEFIKIKISHDKIEKGISIYAEIVGKGIQGDLFTYNQDYGIHVYRITQTSVDGSVVEFSWEQVKKYCEKYGLNHVEEYFVGKVKEMVVCDDSLLGYLQQKYLNKSYPDCKIDEGICIRIRETDEIFKLKSPNFIKMESDNQENEVEEQEL